jgi:hypothetical protein
MRPSLLKSASTEQARRTGRCLAIRAYVLAVKAGGVAVLVSLSTWVCPYSLAPSNFLATRVHHQYSPAILQRSPSDHQKLKCISPAKFLSPVFHVLQ